MTARIWTPKLWTPRGEVEVPVHQREEQPLPLKKDVRRAAFRAVTRNLRAENGLHLPRRIRRRIARRLARRWLAEFRAAQQVGKKEAAA